ncbi:MAG: glycosyltransferase family 4 protein [Polyangiaceae bacterium]
MPLGAPGTALVGYSFQRGELAAAHHDFEVATGGDTGVRSATHPRVDFDSLLLGPWKSAPRRYVHSTCVDVEFDATLRVGEIVTSLHRGGAERVFIDSVHLLRAEGLFVVPLVIDRGQRSVLPAPSGTRLLYEHAKGKQARLALLVRTVMSLGLDVLHVHLIDPETLTGLKALGIPIVLTVHNTRPGWPEGYDALTSEHASLLLGCGRLVAEEIASSTNLPVRILSNAVRPMRHATSRDEVRSLLGLSAGAFVLLCIANLRAQKRLDRVPAIVAELSARGIDAHALILGESLSDGAAVHARIDEECSRHGVHERVHLLGPKEDVVPFLAMADLFLSTSDFEGLSIAQLEAIQAGMPLVLTDVGGVRELWEGHGRPTCMKLLPPDSTPNAYADAIVSAHGSPERPKLASAFSANVYARRLREQLVEHASAPAEEGLLLITNNFATGGAQTSARRLLKALAESGRRVAAAVIEENPRAQTAGLRALRASGITVYEARNAREHDPLETTDDIATFARTRGFRTIVFWNVIAEHKVLIADALSGRRLFDVSPGEMYFASLARYFERPRSDLPYRTARDYGALLEGVIVKYGDERARASETLGAEAHVIPNGVVLPSGLAIGTGSVIGTVARLSPDKKLEELFEAFQIVRASAPDVRLLVLGGVDGAHADYAESLQRSAPDGIGFVPECDDPSAFLDTLDVFAMISEPAGCPNALLEAMAHGLPIVATDVGGARELVGDAGVVVPRAHPKKLAHALMALLTHPGERARFGAAARARAEARYSIQTMGDRYASLFFPRGASQ